MRPITLSHYFSTLVTYRTASIKNSTVSEQVLAEHGYRILIFRASQLSLRLYELLKSSSIQLRTPKTSRSQLCAAVATKVSSDRSCSWTINKMRLYTKNAAKPVKADRNVSGRQPIMSASTNSETSFSTNSETVHGTI